MKSSSARIGYGLSNTLNGGASGCFTRLRLWRSMSVWADISSHLACGKRAAFSMQKWRRCRRAGRRRRLITSGRRLVCACVGLRQMVAAGDAMAARAR
jgi:hypothetical protein